jgi:hypothetical protein
MCLTEYPVLDLISLKRRTFSAILLFVSISSIWRNFISLSNVCRRISNSNCFYKVTGGIIDACPRVIPTKQSDLGADQAAFVATTGAVNYLYTGDPHRDNMEVVLNPSFVYFSSESLGGNPRVRI